ncbi:glycoside hydrolase superfamily [Trichoderma velutinum]
MMSNEPWWKDAVVYQIYPSSFLDSNGDGTGDIQGIIQGLDHIKSLGADTIWLSPVYESPMVDMGYDISNYEKINPLYGTLEDMHTLIATCHSKNMKIVMDLIINHTSDKHAWFLESQSSRDNPKADWYHWHDGRVDSNGKRSVPNNWESYFGGSAWEWCPVREQYYLHMYSVQQPDINWDNMEAREAVYNSAMRFWLDKGIDGFRIDTMPIYIKPRGYPDAPIKNPASYTQRDGGWEHHPAVFDLHCEFYDKVWSKYGDLLLVGELLNIDDKSVALKYCSKSAKRVSMGFQFDTACIGYELDWYEVDPWTIPELAKTIADWQQFIEGTDGWTCQFLENHDIGRSVDRFGSRKYQERSAKLLATLQATCTGTLFVFQGQEIGMTNVPKDWPIEEYIDVSSQLYWERAGKTPEAMANLQLVGRDNSRTPMQWSGKVHGGFTTGRPWMRVNENYADINVEKQNGNPASVLNYWRKVLELRRQYSQLFVYGTFRLIESNQTKVVIYRKRAENSTATVILNFSDEEASVDLPDDIGDLVVSNVDSPGTAGQLQPWEARVYIAQPP